LLQLRADSFAAILKLPARVGAPSTDSMAGLGPKPRINAPGGGMGVAPPGAGGGLAFYDGPSGSMQPGSFGAPSATQGVPPPQGVQPPQPPVQQPFPAMSSSSMQQPVGGSMQPGSGFATPQQPQQSGNWGNPSDEDIENEPPILEELGINVEHIVMRMKGVAFFKAVNQEILEDLDLSGPLAIIMALGTCLLLAGKITFSYVYGFGVSGCVLIWALINLMSQKGGIDLYRTASVLGYGLIPVVAMAMIGIFVSLQSTFGSVIAALCIAWSTATASRFFATANAMNQQRWLVAYPVGLFYTCFSLLTVF